MSGVYHTRMSLDSFCLCRCSFGEFCLFVGWLPLRFQYTHPFLLLLGDAFFSDDLTLLFCSFLYCCLFSDGKCRFAVWKCASGLRCFVTGFVLDVDDD